MIPRAATLTIGSAGVGVRINVFRSAVASLGMVIPVTRDVGLQAGLTPTLAVQIGL